MDMAIGWNEMIVITSSVRSTPTGFAGLDELPTGWRRTDQTHLFHHKIGSLLSVQESSTR